MSVLVVGAVVTGTGWAMAPGGTSSLGSLVPGTPSTGSVACSGVGISGNAQMDSLDGADYAQQMREVRSLGAERVRIGAVWSDIEQAKGRDDWSRLDSRVRAAEDAGLTPLLVLHGAPSWVDLASANATSHAGDFGAFAGRVAKRYGTAIDGFEIWNEPNLARFWDRPDPRTYTAFLRSAYASIHEQLPNATVLSGGLAPAGNGAESMAPLDFLDGMYAAGAADVTDAIGLHPFTFPETPSGTSNWNYFRIMAQMRTTMEAAGDGAKKFWFTEYGAPTGGEGGVTEAAQATMVKEVLENQGPGDTNGPVFLYTLRDLDLGNDDPESHFGVFRANGDPKKSADAVRALLEPCGS